MIQINEYPWVRSENSLASAESACIGDAMAAIEKCPGEAPRARQRAFLRLLIIAAVVFFGVGYASPAGAHSLDRLSYAPIASLFSEVPDNCPCPDCDHGVAACCCVSACATSAGVITASLNAPTLNRDSRVALGDHPGIASAIPSPLFRPPKLP